jgi:hypothetical protein
MEDAGEWIALAEFRTIVLITAPIKSTDNSTDNNTDNSTD